MDAQCETRRAWVTPAFEDIPLSSEIAAYSSAELPDPFDPPIGE